MDTLLVLTGLGGALIAIVNLTRPRGHFGLVNRQRAGAMLAGSFAIILIGSAIAPADGDHDARATSTATTVAASTTRHTGPVGAEIVTVRSIIDGDTLTVTLANGGSDTVRLIGIDTPELGECFAEEATAVLTALTPPGSQIEMTVDVSDRDRFDRLLRYLWVGEMSVNEELVRRGAAVARRYPPDIAMAERFEEAEGAAQLAELGRWAPGACGPVSESEPRILELF